MVAGEHGHGDLPHQKRHDVQTPNSLRVPANDDGDTRKLIPTRRPISTFFFLSIGISVFMSVSHLWKDPGIELWNANDDPSKLTAPFVVKTLPPKTEVCSRTSHFFATTELRRALDAAKEFHIQGGNLKSIQDYSNSQIDATLERLKLTLVPDWNWVDHNITSNFTHQLEQYYTSHRVKQGGYKMKLPGRFAGFNAPQLNEKRRIDGILEPFDANKWNVSMGPKGPACLNLTTLRSTARRRHEDKFVCGVPHNCTAISIGSNDEWGFETALQQYGCITHTFDCTLKRHKPRNKPIEYPNIHFHSQCVDAHTRSSNGKSYLSYGDVLKKLNMTEPPSIVKIDVEGYEYDILRTIVRHEERLLPEQIMMEVHSATKMVGLPWMLRTLSSAELALFSGMMFTAGGYLPVHHLSFGGCCLEVLYVRTIC
jgi:hypothetical protein